MGLETAFNYIDDLNPLWPDGDDDYVKFGDDQIRGVKNVLVTQFGSLGPAAVTASATELNKLTGCTATSTELSLLAGKTMSSSGTKIDNLPSGTLMLFRSTTAPTGWTKRTEAALNECALRVVTGSITSGGSVNFTTVFNRTATDSHTLTGPESGIQQHGHGTRVSTSIESSTATTNLGGFPLSVNAVANYPPLGTTTPVNSPGGQVAAVPSANALSGHTHPLDLRVKYLDVIIAQKG